MTAAAHRRVVTAEPSPRLARATAPTTVPEHAHTVERRRRERHFRRRRRDLVEDTGIGLVLTIFLLGTTAGLGVLALIEVLLAAAIIASMFTERAVRRRRVRDRRLHADQGRAALRQRAPLDVT